MKKYIVNSVALLLFTTITVIAQKLPEVYSTDAGAIQGYDPVAFFKESKPVMGSKDLHYSWNDASWYFSTQENLDLFKANPETYAPQYGGYCAYGTASGHKATTQPETWTIVNNKLYFNYNTNVQKLWNKNQKGLIDQADKNWPTVKKE
jgi:YHS domain-containing protein